MFLFCYIFGHQEGFTLDETVTGTITDGYGGDARVVTTNVCKRCRTHFDKIYPIPQEVYSLIKHYKLGKGA